MFQNDAFKIHLLSITEKEMAFIKFHKNRQQTDNAA
jgi:hypothetical protein